MDQFSGSTAAGEPTSLGQQEPSEQCGSAAQLAATGFGVGYLYGRAREIRSEAWELFRFSDTQRHIWASYMMTREFGPWLARIAGFMNEVRGIGIDFWSYATTRTGSDAFQVSDLRHNEIGIALGQKSCGR